MADDPIINFNPVITVDGKRPLINEVASAASDVYMFQGWLPVMENTDQVISSEGGGNIDLYDQIGRDPRVAASLRTRAKAVTGREWQVVPFSQEPRDIQIAEYVGQVFAKFPYDRSRRSILRGGVLKGFSVGEVMWDYSEGDTFIKNILYRHQRRFRFAPNGNLHLMTLGNPYPGIDVTIDQTTGLPIRKFQTFTFGDEVTTPYGNGLGQELYWPWWFKKNGIKFWLIFIEKFASPTAAGEYADGTDPAKQQELLNAAAALHSNSAVIYPQGMNLKLIEAARGGNISSYKELCDFMNDEMTISILGQTATTSGKPGGLGNAEEQQQVLEDYLKDDGDSLCEAQNDRTGGVIPWLVDYQFPGTRHYPRIEIISEDGDDSKTLAERDKNLAAAMKESGLRFTRSYYIKTHQLEDDDLEETTGTLPPPTPPKIGGEPKTPPPSAKKGAGGGQVSFAEAAANLSGEAELTALAESFTPEALQTLIEGPLKAVFNLIDQGGNLVDLMDDLIKIYPDMNTDKLQDMLARMIFVSEVWGRLKADE